MSILSTIKDALHIGDDKKADEELIAEVEESSRVKTDHDITMPNGSNINFGNQAVEVDVDFWVKKTKAELYKIGAANEVVEANNEENEKVVSVKVPKKYLEASAVALNNLFGDEKYYDLSAL